MSKEALIKAVCRLGVAFPPEGKIRRQYSKYSIMSAEAVVEDLKKHRLIGPAFSKYRPQLFSLIEDMTDKEVADELIKLFGEYYPTIMNEIDEMDSAGDTRAGDMVWNSIKLLIGDVRDGNN